MSKIMVLCGGGENLYSSAQGFIHALKSLGHNVWSAGRRYFDRCLTDLELPPKAHPEYYSYRMVLSQCPWRPDLVICFDPGGFFCGEKPQGLKSVLVSTDAHRCGAMLREVIKNGSYDLFANLQPNYSHFFTDLVRVHTSIPAFDDRRFSLDVNTEPVCDISFCGQTGLNLVKAHWDTPDGQDEVGRYISDLKNYLPNSYDKYAFSCLPSFDYAERGELLYRLSQDFDVRIYEPMWDERLQLALQKGRVGFNRSILNDYSIRNLEIAASGRPLVTDDIHCGPWPPMVRHWESGLYRPFYGNFTLEYEAVKEKISLALKYDLSDAIKNREYVFATHTWKRRAIYILREMGI